MFWHPFWFNRLWWIGVVLRTVIHPCCLAYFPPQDASRRTLSLLHVVARGKTMEKRFQVPRIWKIATTQFDCTFFFCVSVDDTAELPFGAAIFCNYQTGFARISIMAGILLHVTHYFFHRCFCCPQVFFQSSVNRHFLHQVELDVPVTCVTILGAWWPKETIWMKTPISGYRLADWTSFSQVGEVYIQMNVPFLQFRWLRRHHWRHAFLSEWKTPWIMDWKTHNVWKNGCHIARPYFRNRQLGYWK